ILLSITTEVLELQEFDDTYFLKQIKEIQVLEHNLVRFVFQDGRMVDKHWQNKSRSESWSEEAREKARMRQMDYLGRRNSICSQQEQ
ncbi:MAG: recombinase family protein, partial [Caloramator sp.]|nr:recombinase family protein [Caloramator sp.]